MRNFADTQSAIIYVFARPRRPPFRPYLPPMLISLVQNATRLFRTPLLRILSVVSA